MDQALAFQIGAEFRLGEATLSDVFSSPGDLVSTLLPNVYILAGLILFVFLLFGGFGIIMGAQGGNPDQVGKGKNAITTALIGFGLIFASYWIIQIIQWVTGINILNPPEF
jgi:hypothetical protein